MIAIAVAFAPGMARVTRSAALNVRNQDYVKAAIARGEGAPWIIFREMLPNVIGADRDRIHHPRVFAVMLFATLSFLGVGAQPPASEWGLMVADARQYMHQAPWGLIAPSPAIALTAIASTWSAMVFAMPSIRRTSGDLCTFDPDYTLDYVTSAGPVRVLHDISLRSDQVRCWALSENPAPERAHSPGR